MRPASCIYGRYGCTKDRAEWHDMNGPQAAARAVDRLKAKYVQLHWRSRWESTNDGDPITLHTRRTMLRRPSRFLIYAVPHLELFQLIITLDTVYKFMSVPGRNTEMMHPHINAP
jgi:hypothetical protein